MVDKPAGLVVHPGAGNPTGTLVQGLLARYPELAVGGRPGPARHRAPARQGHLRAAASSPARPRPTRRWSRSSRPTTVDRRYLALVWGELETLSGMVDAPIGRSAREPTRMAVSARGKEARTRYEVVTTYRDPVVVSLLECRLETGRTHQIRVHLSAIDHPVVGDVRYGGARPALPAPRPWLHAARSALHPSDDREPI